MIEIAILKRKFTSMGGLEKYTYRLAKEFQKKGYSVAILTTEIPKETENLTFIALGKSYLPRFLHLFDFDKRCRKWLQAHCLKIIFGMDRNRFQTHLRAGNGVHAAFLDSRSHSEGKWKKFLCYCNPLHWTQLYFDRSAFENDQLQTLFVNSYMVKKEVLTRYKIDPKKICVVHNGVQWKEWEKPFTDWEKKKLLFAEKEKLDPHLFHFLFIGHNYQRKGLFQLLKALALLDRKDFCLSVIGKDRHVERYSQLADHLGIQNQIHFFGIRKDILSFYQLCDCLVIPSYYDPFANVTVEALAMGLFVVSSKSNGGSEILKESNGVIIKNLLDTHSLCASLEYAMARPKTKRSAEKIRNSVQSWDFSRQLGKIIDTTLK